MMLTKQRRTLRRVEVERAPRLGLIRPTSLGFRVTVRLHDGQTPEDYTRVLDKLAHAWKVHSVRLAGWKPGKVTLVATLAGSTPTGVREGPCVLRTASW